jgi:hypothetical protein
MNNAIGAAAVVIVATTRKATLKSDGRVEAWPV